MNQALHFKGNNNWNSHKNTENCGFK
jgi:hypothetical protein